MSSSSSTDPLRFVSGGCGGADKSLQLWSLARSGDDDDQHWSVTTAQVSSDRKHSSAVNALAYMRCIDSVLSTGPDLRLRATDIRTGKALGIKVQTGEIYQLHTSQEAGGAYNSTFVCEVSAIVWACLGKE